MATPSNNRNSSARKTGGKAGGRAGRPSGPIAGTKDRTVRVPKEWNATYMDPTNHRGGNQRPTGGRAGGRAGLPSGRIAGQSAPKAATPQPPKPAAAAPKAPAAKASTPVGSKVSKGLRALAGTKARAAGTGLSVAGSVLSGDAKGAAITGGTYAAGKGLQALPHAGAKLAGKALEFAAPFAPGIAGALSSGSAKARPNKTSSGAKTKADLIGGNAPKKPSSFNEKAYASQQKFSVPKSETPKQSAPAKPSPAASRPAAAPNRAPAAAPRMRAPVRRPSAPAPMASKQTGDKAKDMETWRKANPVLAKALDERLAKKQSAAALRISDKFNTKADIYSPSTKVDGSKLDASKIDQNKVSEYRRRKDRYYS
jgi:hypothetical protein